MFEEIWLIPLGFIAGVLGSMIGLGGGIIIVPVLTFLGFPPTVAASNSLFATFSNAVASTISYSRQKRIEYSIGFKLVVLAIPGNILGAFIATQTTPEIFKILFGFVLISGSLYLFWKRKTEEKNSNTSKQVLILAIGASFFAGLISSFFGIGGGIIFVPLMVVAMGMSMTKAAPTSQFILMFGSLAGLVTHSFLGHPDYYQSLLLMIGAFFGGLVGARLSLEVKDKNLKILISVVLFAAAIKLFMDTMTDFNF